jgi:hypothetical protein
LKPKPGNLILFIIILAVCTCIDPYKPKLTGYDSVLVVDGLITNQNESYEVKLTRSIQEPGMIPENVSDAKVFITDENGKRTDLKNLGKGLYKTDSILFTGIIGKTYMLNIIAGNGREYRSEPCIMLPVPEIDSIYYMKDMDYSDNYSETHNGIRIYLDSKPGDDYNNNFRWEYEETWKFKMPLLGRYKYIDEKNIIPLTELKEFCWKTEKSSAVLHKSIPAGQPNIIIREPICFITPDKSDRLSFQYSILIKQFSVSAKESEFWENLKKVNESTGDVFGSQPFPVISNIHNINDPEENVLGYFCVSAVSQKRRYITFSELSVLNLPIFHYKCTRIETSPEDYACQFCVPLTWDEVYQMWHDAKFTFIEPYYISDPKVLKKLVFATDICSNCELTGTITKPDFWIDMN